MFIARIGISYEVIRWEEKLLIDTSRELGLEVVPLHLHNIRLLVGLDGRKLERELEDIDIVLQRAISHIIALNSSLALESMGIRSINNSFSMAIAMNKLWTAKLLVQNNIKIPRTIVAFSDETCFRSADILRYPLVVKPIDGSWGRLIAMARDDEELRSVLEHRNYIPNPVMKVHMLQEFVKKPNRDIRIFVIGEEVPAAIYRVSNHWITNTARGGKAISVNIDSELRELALKTARIIGGEILGIDIFEDQERGYVVNEVNAVPEFKNTVVATGVPIHLKIIEYVKSQVKR